MATQIAMIALPVGAAALGLGGYKAYKKMKKKPSLPGSGKTSGTGTGGNAGGGPQNSVPLLVSISGNNANALYRAMAQTNMQLLEANLKRTSNPIIPQRYREIAGTNKNNRNRASKNYPSNFSLAAAMPNPNQSKEVSYPKGSFLNPYNKNKHPSVANKAYWAMSAPAKNGENSNYVKLFYTYNSGDKVRTKPFQRGRGVKRTRSKYAYLQKKQSSKSGSKKTPSSRSGSKKTPSK